MRRIAQGAVFVLGLAAIVLALNAWIAAPDSATPMKPVLLTPSAAALNNAQPASTTSLPSVDVSPLPNVPMGAAPSEAGRAPEHKPHKHYARAWVRRPPVPPEPDPAPAPEPQLATAPHPSLTDPSALFPHDPGPLRGQ